MSRVEINKTILENALNSVYLENNDWGLKPAREGFLLPKVVYESNNKYIKLFVLEFIEVPDKVLAIIYHRKETRPGKHTAAEMLSLLGYSPSIENSVNGTADNKKGEKLRVLAAFFSKEKHERQDTDTPMRVL